MAPVIGGGIVTLGGLVIMGARGATIGVLVRRLLNDNNVRDSVGRAVVWRELAKRGLEADFNLRRELLRSERSHRQGDDLWEPALLSMAKCSDGECRAVVPTGMFEDLVAAAGDKVVSLEEVITWVSANIMLDWGQLEVSGVPNRAALGWLRYAKENEKEFRALELRVKVTSTGVGRQRTKALPPIEIDYTSDDDKVKADGEVEDAWSKL